MQLSHTALSGSFEQGDWDAWLEETAALEPEGYYLGWRVYELALRAAFRGDPDTAHELLAQSREMVGESSSQATASMGAADAALALASGDWPAVMPGARRGWGHYDVVLSSVGYTLAAAAAAGETTWADEAAMQLPDDKWRGRYPAGLRSFAMTVAALLEERWSDARTGYAATRQTLVDTGAGLWVGMLDLAFSTRAAGKLAEADDAGAKADAFFTSLGANAFVERYRASIVASGRSVPASETPVRSGRATA